MIYITGDTHGSFERVQDFCDKIGTKKIDKMEFLFESIKVFEG